MRNNYYPFINTPLPYSTDALEPYIDQKTMELHHNRHLQTYIDRLNSIVENNPELQKWSLEEMVSRWCNLPQNLQTEVKNNAGGVYNHRFFFEGMHAANNHYIERGLQLIFQPFGGEKQFREAWKKVALDVFGSGYTWLVLERGVCKIITTCNQNTPNVFRQIPLLNLDVWEHAYYLKHYNQRAAYIEDWFHVVDWKKVNQKFLEVSQCPRY